MQFFFFKDSATTEIYTLSLHDALPISRAVSAGIDLDTLIRGELLAHPSGKDQVRISGPDVELPAKAAEVLTLAIHELTTNSVKYGALMEQIGRASCRERV